MSINNIQPTIQATQSSGWTVPPNLSGPTCPNTAQLLMLSDPSPQEATDPLSTLNQIVTVLKSLLSLVARLGGNETLTPLEQSTVTTAPIATLGASLPTALPVTQTTSDAAPLLPTKNLESIWSALAKRATDLIPWNAIKENVGGLISTGVNWLGNASSSLLGKAGALVTGLFG